jgi:DNA-binding HxlR family transcriptional regulator
MRADGSIAKCISGVPRTDSAGRANCTSTLESLRDKGLQSRNAIQLLASKWRVAVLHLLTPRPMRANELQRALEEVSPKMLTQTLRGLEEDGLVHREILTIIPAHVEYELTEMGKSVIPLLHQLCEWASAAVKHREDARRCFAHSTKNSERLSRNCDRPLRPPVNGESKVRLR